MRAQSAAAGAVVALAHFSKDGTAGGHDPLIKSQKISRKHTYLFHVMPTYVVVHFVLVKLNETRFK